MTDCIIGLLAGVESCSLPCTNAEQCIIRLGKDTEIRSDFLLPGFEYIYFRGLTEIKGYRCLQFEAIEE